ncbi:hypothetical protein Droror1_Dr00002123 [Drosera rotundifolia]
MDQNSNGDSKCETLTEPVAVEPIQRVHLSDDAAKVASDAEVPDWLPAGWRVDTRVRAAGASAGTKDKYYFHLETGRRFRSKAEVMSFLETGVTGQKKRTTNGAGESSPENGSHSKRSKKAAPKISAAVKNFNFDDVPAKVKWELTDIHEGTWRPFLDVGVSVPESTRQQWAETFTYLTMNQDVQAI